MIEESRKKYKALEPFWNYIAEIEDGNLIEERNENGVTKVEERIKERLRMFFGLLKRSFEDSKYNEQFHYSDMKLLRCVNLSARLILK